jgi:hypothetical protein
LGSGSATINIAAGSLSTGLDTLTATYTPDTNSSSTYNSATGTGTVTVSTSAPTSSQTPVSLSSSANAIGIYTDGTTFGASGGLDGAGDAYSETEVGLTATVSGTTFTLLPANQPNVVRGSSTSVIPLPSGSYTTLSFLANTSYGGQANQTFTVNYTDGTSTQFTQSMSDWWQPQGNNGETEAIQCSYIDLSGGSREYQTVYVYQYSFTLNSSKTVKSFTLPNNTHITVEAITLLAP